MNYGCNSCCGLLILSLSFRVTELGPILPKASFGLRALSLPASVSVHMSVRLCVNHSRNQGLRTKIMSVPMTQSIEMRKHTVLMKTAVRKTPVPVSRILCTWFSTWASGVFLVGIVVILFDWCQVKLIMKSCKNYNVDLIQRWIKNLFFASVYSSQSLGWFLRWTQYM